MTVQDAFNTLSHNLRQLDDALAHLEWAVINGPPSPAPAPVGELYDRVIALRGSVAEAQTAVTGLGLSSPTGTQLASARRALADCQRHLGQTLTDYYQELSTPAVTGALHSLMVTTATGYRPTPDAEGWKGWAYGVRDALDNCATPLSDLNLSLTQCWRELADHADPPAVLVHLAQIRSEPASTTKTGWVDLE